MEDEFDVCVRLSQGLVPLKPEDCRIKDSLWAFIQRCWEFVPKDRPTSINALDFAEIEFRATLSTYTVKNLIDESPVVAGRERSPATQPSQGTPSAVSAWSSALENHPTSILSSPEPSRVVPSATTIDSRRSSVLSQGVSVRDGVTVLRDNIGSGRPGMISLHHQYDHRNSNTYPAGSVVFVADASALFHSSPVSAPAVKTEVMKSFGIIPATPSNHANGTRNSWDRSPMVGPSSQGGPDNPVGSNRRRAERGEKGHGSREATISFKGQSDADSSEIVECEVKALLDELTMERFDSISDEIIQWMNKNKDTLAQVIRLVLEKAAETAAFSEMYARLCWKMMEQISPELQDDGYKDMEGKPIAGSQLFRKYFLDRCQDDFERVWFVKEATAAAAAAKAFDDQATKAANENKDTEEAQLYSDEYYAAQKAKRQGLGLIKFIGELFKLQMLTERIMHECVKKLLGNVENPEEEEIESLCQLLKTVGQLLDTPKARAHMDVYFTRMKELGKSTNVSSRMQFMLQVCGES